MDLLKPEGVEAHVRGYCELFHTEEWMFTSFRKKQNIDKLTWLITKHLPEREPLYSEDEITDTPMRVLAAEIVREKVLLNTHHEVPYSVATVVEHWEEDADLARIDVAIVVERESHKAIVIGQKGKMIKKIGTEARLEIEELLGKHVFVKLFVKVREDWRSNPRMLKDLGYL
jgi:GTP-binding protein Era